MKGKTKRIFKAASLVLAAAFALPIFLTACSDQGDDSGNGKNIQEGWGDANWIWGEDTSTRNQWENFRRDFTLDEAPDSAEIRIACDTKYWLYVNDELVIFEGSLTRGEDEGSTYYDVVDIAENLQEGENSICVLAWYWGYGGYRIHYYCSEMAGLLVSTSLTDSGTGETVETGDGEWYCRDDEAFLKESKRPNAYLGEWNIIYDARYAVDWTDTGYDPADEGWGLAQQVGEDGEDIGYAGDDPWCDLIERPIPQWKDYGLTEFSDEDECEVTQSGSTTVYTYTLPYNMQIYPYIRLADGTEEGIDISVYTDTCDMSSLSMSYTTCEGAQEYEHKGWISGNCLTFEIPDGAEAEALGYRQTGYNVESGDGTLFRGYFDSTVSEEDPSQDSFTGGWGWEEDEVSADNNFYDELWKKAEYTLYVCMRDTYMDCPDRERGQYIGDAINEIEEAFYVMGPETNALSAKAIRQICATQITYTYNGETYYAMSCIAPIGGLHEIPVQELGTAVAAWKYYLYTGDATVLQDCFTAMYNYLTNYDFEESGAYSGTIRMRAYEELKYSDNLSTAQLDDWSDWGDNQDTRVAINCWWYMSATAVRKMTEVADVAVTDDQIEWLDESIAQVEENFDKFWDDDLQAYASEWGDEWRNPVSSADGSHLVDDRVNALAVVSGLADSSKYEAIRNVFMGTDDAPAYENASIYMEKYVIQALYEMGYDCDAMDRLQSRHMRTVNDENCSTLPELWPDATVTELSYGDGTVNHGWSGGGLIAMSRYAAGIEPLEPGYESYIIRPMRGYFESISSNVPSEIGDIRLDLTESSMRVTLPDGGEAQIWVPLDDADTVTLLSGDASYLGLQAYGGRTYAVYTASAAGTYSFSIV